MAPGQDRRRLDGFFKDPYLLWFVAEDVPVHGRLPKNIAEVTRAILRSAQGAPGCKNSSTPPSGWSAGRGSRNGAASRSSSSTRSSTPGPRRTAARTTPSSTATSPPPNTWSRAGPKLTLASAVCLGRWDDARRLSATASESEKQFALVLAALNGKAEAVKWMVEAGADVNRPSADLYAHGTPLHHAVCSGSLATVRALVEAGADPAKPDTAWNGTPLGWAEHYLTERKDDDSQRRYGEIADYLRARRPHSPPEPQQTADNEQGADHNCNGTGVDLGRRAGERP